MYILNTYCTYVLLKYTPNDLPREQDCQMVYLHTKNPNLGIFWRALDWKMLLSFIQIWDNLWQFGRFIVQLVHFFPFWFLVPRKI
jgi:hypothetical protein